MKHLIVSLFLLLPVASASGRRQVSPAMTSDVVEAIGDRLRETYAFPERAEEVIAHVAARMRAGAYDEVSTAHALAELLTRDLRAFTDDVHFSVRYDTNRHEGIGSMGFGPNPALRMFEENQPEEDVTPYQALLGQLAPTNFGMPHVEVLEGNIGYIEFGIFPPLQLAQATVDAALTFLAHTDALVIDLRTVPGGVGGFTPYLASYFFGEPEKLLFSRTFAWADRTNEFRVTADIGGTPRPETPLFILTSAMTASAAENLAYTLQQHGRATVVGEATRGGAHSSSMMQLPHGFVAQIPIARVVHPVSGTNWQGTGVLPDVATSRELALAVAACLARQATGTRPSQPCEKAGEEPVAESALADYAGTYGIRRVFEENGRLMYQREGGPAVPLTRKSGDVFGFDLPAAVRSASNLPDLRFDRQANGAVYQISTLEEDGSVREVFVRD